MATKRRQASSASGSLTSKDEKWNQLRVEFLRVASLANLSNEDREIEAGLFINSLRSIPREVGGNVQRERESAKVRARANAKFVSDLRRLVASAKAVTHLGLIELSGEDMRKGRSGSLQHLKLRRAIYRTQQRYSSHPRHTLRRLRFCKSLPSTNSKPPIRATASPSVASLR